MSPINPSSRPHIYCDLSPNRTERGFSLESSRSIEDLAKNGLTLESAIGLQFVFGDGSLCFNGVVIHDPEFGFLAAGKEPTEAELRSAKASRNNIFNFIPIFLSLASLSFVLTLVIAAIAAGGGGRNLGEFVFNGCAIGAALGLLAIVLAVINAVRNKGKLLVSMIAIILSVIALCVHLPIVLITIWTVSSGY